MRVTRAEEYGVRLVMTLAASGGQLTVRELAAAEDLPEPTVAKIINRLRRGGIVDSERGRNGGYRLSEPADRLTLAEVIEVLEGSPGDHHFCSRMTPGGEVCSRRGDCQLRPVWRGLGSVIRDFLGEITVNDLIHGDLDVVATALERPLPLLRPGGLPASPGGGN